jgi:hypothetical protein
LKATQERIAYFEGLVAQFRVTTAAAEFELMAGGYLSEVEKMNAEILRISQASPQPNCSCGGRLTASFEIS